MPGGKREGMELAFNWYSIGIRSGAVESAPGSGSKPGNRPGYREE